MIVDFKRTRTKLNTFSILGKEVGVVERKMVHIFYQSVVARANFFSAICWCTSIRATDSKKLNKRIMKAGSVLGTALQPLQLVV